MKLLKKHLPELLAIMNNESIDAWLLYSFNGLNPIAEKITGITEASRQWAMLLDNQGNIKILCQSIEAGYFRKFTDNSPAVYTNQKSFHEEFKKLLHGCSRVAMEYSPNNEIPYVSKIDAGTMELIAKLSPNTVAMSSATLAQQCLSTWDQPGAESHQRSLNHLHEIINLAWEQIRHDITSVGHSDEYAIQQLILKEFESRNLETNHPPVVAVGVNSADAHYCPTEEHASLIAKNQVLMIDLWAKEKTEEAVYADITWMGYTGTDIPAELASHWSALTQARNAGLELLREQHSLASPVSGWQVDKATRDILITANLGEYFTHRTGHSIAADLHAQGVNMDNYELQDTRKIIPDCGFSIEPGIYIPGQYGLRTEIDVHIDKEGVVQVYGPIQNNLITL